jgi:sulfate transport system substrate-binding protein
VLLVRKGNPKNIKDWADLVRKDVEVVSPNPKTSGGARWGYLAAWGYALKKYNNDQAKAKDFVTKIFSNVKVLDSGARGSLISFSERNIGDVVISWENEAYLAMKAGSDKFEVITPSLSILAEPPVAVVDKIVDKHNTRKVATAYLDYLYSEEGQNIIAKNFYRPVNAKVLAKYSNSFKPLQLFTVKELFGNWDIVHKTHFANGAIFDQIMLNKNYAK